MKTPGWAGIFIYFADVITHLLPTAPSARRGGGCSTWVNGLPRAPLLYAMPKKSQTSIVATPGSSSARPRSSCWEEKLQRCAGASPLPRVRVLVPGPWGETLCPWPSQGSPAELLAGGWHGASTGAEQELAWLWGRGGGGGGRLCVCVCARERPWRGEELQRGRMDGWSWAGGLLLSSSSCAFCPEKPYLNKWCNYWELRGGEGWMPKQSLLISNFPRSSRVFCAPSPPLSRLLFLPEKSFEGWRPAWPEAGSFLPQCRLP